MYKAKVDSVNGIKVRAGGKWLTCIGNKNVKVGDFIWTDGRCVYGNYLEAQTPFVFTPKEDVGIPITAYSNDKNLFLSFYSKNFSLPQTFSEDNLFNNTALFVNNRNTSFIIQSERTVPLPNIQSIRSFAANLDNNNNLYLLNIVYPKIEEIITEYDIDIRLSLREAVWTQSWLTNHTATVDDGWQIQITKNNFPVLNIDIRTIFEQEILSASVPGNFEIKYLYPKCCFAFVENENNWGILLYCEAHSYECYEFMLREYEEGITNGLDGYETFPGVTLEDNYRLFPDGLYDWRMMVGVQIGYHDEWNRGESRYSGGFYFVSPKGIQKIFGATLSSPNRNSAFVQTVKSANEDSIRFPIQDGYSFSVKILSESYADVVPYTIEYKIWALHTLYSPELKILFKGIFPLGTYFSIYKIHNELYLVGVKFPPLSKYSHVSVNSDEYGVKLFEQGLYILKNGFLSDLYVDPNFSCLNQSFHPIKNFKHWWKNIQSF